VNLYDVVELVDDIPEHELAAGSAGTIVHVHQSPRLAYEVEFVDEDGHTQALATVTPDQVRPFSAGIG
jgi:hypothetical protein